MGYELQVRPVPPLPLAPLKAELRARLVYAGYHIVWETDNGLGFNIPARPGDERPENFMLLLNSDERLVQADAVYLLDQWGGNAALPDLIGRITEVILGLGNRAEWGEV